MQYWADGGDDKCPVLLWLNISSKQIDSLTVLTVMPIVTIGPWSSPWYDGQLPSSLWGHCTQYYRWTGIYYLLMWYSEPCEISYKTIFMLEHYIFMIFLDCLRRDLISFFLVTSVPTDFSDWGRTGLDWTGLGLVLRLRLENNFN